MLSLTSVIVVWRWARAAVPLFLLVVVPLCASTVLLRYHWPIDVAVGALLAWPVARLFDLLLDRDGASPA
jgi:membrane-associated phospholipid phosphatase